jgi:hypothetical protein
MRLSTLQLAPMHRVGGRSDTGGTTKDRQTFDFVVDDRSLAELLGVNQSDLVGRLDRDDRGANVQSVRVLTGDATPDFGTNRVMLFVCPECGDLGCGAITAAFRSDGEVLTWSDFKHENNYDEAMSTSFPQVGPFTFDARAYRRVLSEAAD